MKLFLVWNVDKARAFNKRGLTMNRAGRLADLLENRHGDHYVITVDSRRASA